MNRMRSFVGTLPLADEADDGYSKCPDGGIGATRLTCATFVCLIFATNWSVSFPQKHSLTSEVKRKKSIFVGK